jgi:X-X-X-Leu-X-X-Gly heptad repeat protein
MNRLTAGAAAAAALLLTACGGITGTGATSTVATGTVTTGTGTVATGTGTVATGTGTVATGTGTGTGTGTTTISGRFLIEGGPMRPGGGQPGERPLRGTVTFSAAGSPAVSVPVGRSGAFSVALAPGTYHVSGRSPEIMEMSGGGAQHETVCSRPLAVHITGQHALKIAVTCIVP